LADKEYIRPPQRVDFGAIKDAAYRFFLQIANKVNEVSDSSGLPDQTGESGKQPIPIVKQRMEMPTQITQRQTKHHTQTLLLTAILAQTAF
jgi:hypothetical protein